MIIPLIFALMGLPFVFLTVTIIPIGADARNTLAFTIHLALAIYSFAILAKLKDEGIKMSEG